MHPRIRSLWTGARASGRAFTVRTAPGDNASLHEALEQVSEGDLLVVDGGTFNERSLWGAIMSEAAALAGVTGLVVDGAVRDLSEIRSLQFPVFAVGVTPTGPYNKVPGKIGGAIHCGDVAVNPGDWVHADEDGVVVIPAQVREETLSKARRRHELEEEILTGLRAGEALSSVLPILRKSATADVEA